MAEEFRIIKDFPNYEVSNLGRVRNVKTGKILKQTIANNGYFVVNFRKNNKSYTKTVHRIVASMFLRKIENKPFVDHIDGNKTNNHINNLRYVTNQENAMNAKLNCKTTTNIKGVTYYKNLKKWIAQITVNGKHIHIGCFDNIEDAINARVKKAKELFGEYINKCEKEININLNIPKNTKVKLNINIKSQEDQELEDLEREFNEILNRK